jgi:hypothetical protein
VGQQTLVHCFISLQVSLKLAAIGGLDCIAIVTEELHTKFRCNASLNARLLFLSTAVNICGVFVWVAVGAVVEVAAKIPIESKNCNNFYVIV